MTWEEKFTAIIAVAGWQHVSLHMRQPGDWYVSDPLHVTDGVIASSPTESGSTPQAAVEEHFRRLTKLKPNEYVITTAALKNRKAYKWNGYMWEPYDEDA